MTPNHCQCGEPFDQYGACPVCDWVDPDAPMLTDEECAALLMDEEG